MVRIVKIVESISKLSLFANGMIYEFACNSCSFYANMAIWQKNFYLYNLFTIETFFRNLWKIKFWLHSFQSIFDIWFIQVIFWWNFRFWFYSNRNIRDFLKKMFANFWKFKSDNGVFSFISWNLSRNRKEAKKEKTCKKETKIIRIWRWIFFCGQISRKLFLESAQETRHVLAI